MYSRKLFLALTIIAMVLVSAACIGIPEPTATTEPTEAPESTDAPTSVASATPTPTPGSKATSTPKPSTAAVVSEDGATLRPGASTWWRPSKVLTTGMELELEGHDPNFPDWVYVSTADGESTGWIQVAELELNRELSELPEVTPRPTLTPTPVGECTEGPLELDAWEVDKNRTNDTWTAAIFAEGHGGDCVYTYAWNGEVQGESMTTSMTFNVTGQGNAPLIGTVSVTSGGETVERELFIRPPSED